MFEKSSTAKKFTAFLKCEQKLDLKLSKILKLIDLSNSRDCKLNLLFKYFK